MNDQERIEREGETKKKLEEEKESTWLNLAGDKKERRGETQSLSRERKEESKKGIF